MSTLKSPDNAPLPEPIGLPPRELKRQPAKGRKMVARALLKMLNEDNCERYGASKVEILRLREVAYGAR
jgi:hypothetical protein